MYHLVLFGQETTHMNYVVGPSGYASIPIMIVEF